MIIKDLNITSIIDMEHDEAIEHLRQVRFNRRLPAKMPKAKIKANIKKATTPKMNKNQAQELLKFLTKGKIKNV